MTPAEQREKSEYEKDKKAVKLIAAGIAAHAMISAQGLNISKEQLVTASLDIAELFVDEAEKRFGKLR